MLRLINNELSKTKRSKIAFTYIIMIISLIIINKYSNKSIFDMSYNLISFIGIFVSLLFSGSINLEIENGTMRYYLTKPYKRYKIYLSKLLTIIFYIILSYIIIVLTTSIIGNNINIKYMYKFLIHMFPIFFLPSLILLLSTYFKSHVFVSCISMLIQCFSLTISQLLFGIKMNIIEYTFLPYLDFSIFNDKLLIINMNTELNTHINMKTGIIIDMIYFTLFLILGIIKFNKKDIKS